MKAPCGNCPFRKDIPPFNLMPGRMAGIVKGLTNDDHASFSCHKTTHGDGKKEQQCAGSIAFLHKQGIHNRLTRMGMHFKDCNPEEIDGSNVYDNTEELLTAYEGEGRNADY